MHLFQDNAGRALTEWTTTQNSQLSLQQFLRFQQTKAVAKKFLLVSALTSDTVVSSAELHSSQVVVKDSNTTEPLDYRKVNINKMQSNVWTDNKTNSVDNHSLRHCLAAPVFSMSTSDVTLAKDSNTVANGDLEKSVRKNRPICPSCCKTFSSKGAVRIHQR